MRLPSSWGLGQAQIHSSLLITLGMLSGLILLLSYNRPGWAEFRVAAFTLPFVWIVSLAVRIATQQLALGELANESETVVGPSGNLRTDYEYLPAKSILAYTITGQLASFGLTLLGMIIIAAMSPTLSSHFTLTELLDIRGGWESRAWATQILWVNLFLFGINLLPTVPFEMRALVFALFSLRNRNVQEPAVFRRMAALDSHLAALMLGSGVTVAFLSWNLGREILGWYGAVAASVYLFVASQWEFSRAEELEQEYSPTPARLTRHDGPSGLHPHMRIASSRKAPNPSKNHQTDGFYRDSNVHPQQEMDGSDGSQADLHDVDEILRKLHREGATSLTAAERQALLYASRQIQEKRGQAT